MATNRKNPAKPKNPGKTGRPSIYTHQLGKDICLMIASGQSVSSIGRELEIPASTIRTWILDDKDGLFDASARAYQLGHEALAEQCLEIADDLTQDPQSRRVRIDTRLRLLGKWAPKRYGDRITHAGDEDSPLVPSEVTVRLVHAQK